MQTQDRHVIMLLQSLEIAAQKTHGLKKKGMREGILCILAPAAQNLLRSLQDVGSIGQFELDSACITWLAKLPSYQQTQVRLLTSACLTYQMVHLAALLMCCMFLTWGTVHMHMMICA